MGLFDFVKDIGEKVFGSNDDPAEKIKEHIESRNPGIKDLNVEFKDGQVNLSGDAASAEAMEKAVLLAGNVQGVTDVGAGNVKAPSQTDKVEYYVIEKGDTLSGIAKKLLGNAMDYPKIFEANKEVIKDPNLIYPGQKIRIPMG
ncbi:MAG: peptidoglycan-binding protein LysM [Nitrospirales bacterium]|nr:MAG: peptidoglycan-binding protein LysM [Nitrospirales bacterium]